MSEKIDFHFLIDSHGKKNVFFDRIIFARQYIYWLLHKSMLKIVKVYKKKK